MALELEDLAECGSLSHLLMQLSLGLDRYLAFEDDDAMLKADLWLSALGQGLPTQGIGIDRLIQEIETHLLPNASLIPKPGFSGFITTGACTSAILAALSGMVAAPQRLGVTAFSYLEELSLQGLTEMFELPACMQGIYSSGGSSANIIALGAARQSAYEHKGLDPARDGVQSQSCIFASAAAHRTIHRAAAVLGMGRNSVVPIALDHAGRMNPGHLVEQIERLGCGGSTAVAIVACAGTTDTGAVDPLEDIGLIARERNIWFHVDGAYGLPGVLDPRCKPLFKGMTHADSVSVDAHKWLGAPVGIGTTFVRDRALLQRAFTQDAAEYLEGTTSQTEVLHSMDSLGIPYYNFGLELSAPCRGAIVWAIIREIGKQGVAERIIRHNAMARHIAERARNDRRLELVLEPSLSICCFRYVDERIADLNELNRQIHRQLVRRGENVPSTTTFNGKLVLRPCFIGARSQWRHADALVDEVLDIGRKLTNRRLANRLPTKGPGS